MTWRLEQDKDGIYRWMKAYPALCQQCGAEFTARHTNAKYCSNRCRQRAYRERTGALQQAGE